MCSEDVDFLCKCLNLLYLIKELILCDLTTNSWHVYMVVRVPFFPNESNCFFWNMFIMLAINQWESEIYQQMVVACTHPLPFTKYYKRE